MESKTETPAKDIFQYKIMVVDDNPDNIILLQYLLEDYEFQVISTTNGEEAIEMARKEDPGVVLLDIQMPEMSGYEVCRRLKNDPETSHIPIIFITARYSSEEDIVSGLEIGANDYITKPFNNTELIARVKVMLRLRKDHDELERLNQKLEKISITDELTGFYNRRFFYTRMKEVVSKKRQKHSSLSVIMIDLDDFKKVNDQYGHVFGDFALRESAELIRKHVRDYDIIARYGGEEFILLLEENQEIANRIAERILTAFQQNVFQKNDLKVRITVSIGIATYGPDNDVGDLEAFIHLADKAMYKAKKNGKNQITFCVRE